MFNFDANFYFVFGCQELKQKFPSTFKNNQEKKLRSSTNLYVKLAFDKKFLVFCDNSKMNNYIKT